MIFLWLSATCISASRCKILVQFPFKCKDFFKRMRWYMYMYMHDKVIIHVYQHLPDILMAKSLPSKTKLSMIRNNDRWSVQIKTHYKYVLLFQKLILVPFDSSVLNFILIYQSLSESFRERKNISEKYKKVAQYEKV